MQSKWTEEEKKLLEAKSRFLFEKPKSGAMTPLSAFLDPAFAAEFLAKEASRIGSNNRKVAASIFMKRYAFLVVGVLFSWSFFRKPVVFSPESIWLVDDQQTTGWMPKFYIEAPVCRRRPGGVEDAFHHIKAVIESLKEATSCSSFVLWENVAVYIFWLYETLGKETAPAFFSEEAEEDFQWLLAPEQASLFGGGRENLLAGYFKEKEIVTAQDKPVRVRVTCCLNFQLKTGGKQCSSCPLKNKRRCKRGKEKRIEH